MKDWVCKHELWVYLILLLSYTKHQHHDIPHICVQTYTVKPK